MTTATPTDHGEEICAYRSDELVVIVSRHHPGERLPVHTHTHGSITAILAGGVRERTRQRTWECEPGSLLVRPPGEPHADEVGRRGVHLVVVEFKGDFAVRQESINAVLNTYAALRIAEATTILARMHAELRRADTFSQLTLEGLAYELAGVVGRARYDGGRSIPSWLRSVRDELHASYGCRMTVAALAQRAGVHPDHLSRSFRHAYGCSIGDYVRRIRIEVAVRRLATRASLSTIAHEVGFSDQSQFTRAFRAELGTSPGRYRAAQREADGDA